MPWMSAATIALFERRIPKACRRPLRRSAGLAVTISGDGPSEAGRPLSDEDDAIGVVGAARRLKRVPDRSPPVWLGLAGEKAELGNRDDEPSDGVDGDSSVLNEPDRVACGVVLASGSAFDDLATGVPCGDDESSDESASRNDCTVTPSSPSPVAIVRRTWSSTSGCGLILRERAREKRKAQDR